MYSIFTWVYGIDMTQFLQDYMRQPFNEHIDFDAMSINCEIEIDNENTIVTQYDDNFAPTHCYVGLDFLSWHESQQPVPAPIESEISNYLKQQLNEKIESFKQQCPVLSSKVDLTPKIFLSTSTS